MKSFENQDRGIRRFAPQATGPPQRQGLLCCSFCDFRVYPFIFAIVVFYFESSLQFQFLKKNYVGGVHSEENRTFLKVKTRRYRLID